MPAPECPKALAMEMMAFSYLLPVSPGIQFLHPQCSPGTLDETYSNIYLDHLWSSISLSVLGLFVVVSMANVGPGA